MSTNNDSNSKNKAAITNDRKVPNEINPPMPKPERKEEDNDFTKGDENDPLRKEKIDRPAKSPVREEGDDDGQNHIQEPVAEEEDKEKIRDIENKLADESVAKTDDAKPGMLQW